MLFPHCLSTLMHLKNTFFYIFVPVVLWILFYSYVCPFLILVCFLKIHCLLTYVSECWLSPENIFLTFLINGTTNCGCCKTQRFQNSKRKTPKPSAFYPNVKHKKLLNKNEPDFGGADPQLLKAPGFQGISGSTCSGAPAVQLAYCHFFFPVWWYQQNVKMLLWDPC